MSVILCLMRMIFNECLPYAGDILLAKLLTSAEATVHASKNPVEHTYIE